MALVPAAPRVLPYRDGSPERSRSKDNREAMMQDRRTFLKRQPWPVLPRRAFPSPPRHCVRRKPPSAPRRLRAVSCSRRCGVPTATALAYAPTGASSMWWRPNMSCARARRLPLAMYSTAMAISTRCAASRKKRRTATSLRSTRRRSAHASPIRKRSFASG